LELSSLSVIGGLHVVPPFSDLLVSTALCAVERSNEMLIACSVPFCENETQGSDARS
jgi:hypothetical protein